jgi:hypothetical protein
MHSERISALVGGPEREFVAFVEEEIFNFGRPAAVELGKMNQGSWPLRLQRTSPLRA